MNLKEALERINDLEAQLAYFKARGQVLMDLTYQQMLKKLEKADNDEMTPAFLTTCTKFIKDQGIVDLNPGGATAPKLVADLPFTDELDESDDSFGTLSAQA